MTDKPSSAAFVPPSAEAWEERLSIGLADAMRSQRAVRMLHLDPVPIELVLELIELALKAPTSSNSQDWCFLIVQSTEQKRRLARLYRPLFKAFNPIEMRRSRHDPKALRQMKPGQWQAEHFDQLPMFVVPCYRRNLKHHPVGYPQISVASFYGSVFPAVQNFLLGCRAVGLGASLQTLPIWLAPAARRALGLPRNMVPVCVIPIGWAKGKYGPTTRPPVGDVVHVDVYGNQPFKGISD